MKDISNKELSVILPIHEFNVEVIKPLLMSAIDSVVKQKTKPNNVSLVFPLEVMDESFQECLSEITEVLKSVGVITNIISNDSGKTDFSSQINKAVTEIKTKWFSILEFDDLYSPIIFDNFDKYTQPGLETEDISLFLSLNNLINKEGKFISFANEIVWSMGFADELGYIDSESLKDFSEYQITGGIFNTNDFIEVGMLKPSIKIAFWNEFLLRLTENKKKVFVMPKVGYIHSCERDGSLTDYYQKNMDVKEIEFWMKTAKKEYFYKEDRNKEYKGE